MDSWGVLLRQKYAETILAHSDINPDEKQKDFPKKKRNSNPKFYNFIVVDLEDKDQSPVRRLIMEREVAGAVVLTSSGPISPLSSTDEQEKDGYVSWQTYHNQKKVGIYILSSKFFIAAMHHNNTIIADHLS